MKAEIDRSKDRRTSRAYFGSERFIFHWFEDDGFAGDVRCGKFERRNCAAVTCWVEMITSVKRCIAFEMTTT